MKFGLGDGSFGDTVTYSSEGYNYYDVSLADINNDGMLDLIAAGEKSGHGYAMVRLGQANGTFTSAVHYSSESSYSLALCIGDVNGDGNLDMVTAGAGATAGQATIRLGVGDGTFGVAAGVSTEASRSRPVAVGDVNGDGMLDLLSTGEDGSHGYSTLRLGRGDGTFGAASSFSAETLFSGDLALGDLNRDGVLDFITTGLNAGGGWTAVKLASTQDGLGCILPFSLKTRSGAAQAMGLLDRTLENLATQRGVIGASQSRVNLALQGMGSRKENFTAAESRIRDADVAAEAATLVRTQILQQAATSVLAQANQAPALALTLLRG